MTNEEKIEELISEYPINRRSLSYRQGLRYGAHQMAGWKDEQINLLLDAIDYAYLKTDGTYGDLALAVVDKVEHLKSLRHGKIE